VEADDGDDGDDDSVLGAAEADLAIVSTSIEEYRRSYEFLLMRPEFTDISANIDYYTKRAKYKGSFKSTMERLAHKIETAVSWVVMPPR